MSSTPPPDTGKPEKPSPSGLKDLIAVCQLLATVAAAGWSIYLFFAFGKAEHELEAQIKSLNVQKAKSDLQQELSHRVVTTDRLDVTDLGPARAAGGEHTYYVEYQATIKNTGSSKIEVTYVLARPYWAEVRLPEAAATVQVNGFKNEGDIHWQPLHEQACYYAPQWDRFQEEKQRPPRFTNSQDQDVPFQRGGGGTAPLDAGEVATSGMELYITAMPHDMIGFGMELGFNGGRSAEDRWYLERWRPLADGEIVTHTGEPDD